MTVFGKLQLTKQPEIHFRWAVISISVMWFQPMNMYTLLTPMLYITHTITIGLPFPACRYLSLHTIFISMVVAKHLGHAPLPAHLDRSVKSILLFLFFPFFLSSRSVQRFLLPTWAHLISLFNTTYFHNPFLPKQSNTALLSLFFIRTFLVLMINVRAFTVSFF